MSLRTSRNDLRTAQRVMAATGGDETAAEAATSRPELLYQADRLAAALLNALPGDWKLADHPKHGRVVVTNPAPDDDWYVYFVRPDVELIANNDWGSCRPHELTYLDTGQGTKKAAHALPGGWRLADHRGHGRVIVTSVPPIRDGRAYYLFPAPDLLGQGCFFCPVDELTYIDKEGDQ